jgi:hypothetical protein
MQCISWKLFFPPEIHMLEKVYALTKKFWVNIFIFILFITHTIFLKKHIFDYPEVYLDSPFFFVNLVKVEFKSITNYSPEMNELDVFFKESNYLLKQYSLLPRYPFVFFTTSRTFEITSSLFFNKIFSYMILNNHEIILQMHFVIHRKYFKVQVHLSHQCWRCYWPSSISLFWWRRY